MPNIQIITKPSFEELARKFKDIDLPEILKDRVKDVAEQLVEASKAHTPVKTGALRDSILVLNAQPLGATIQAQENYAFFVHEGTKKMSARPFMELGANDTIKNLDRDLARDIEDEIADKIK